MRSSKKAIYKPRRKLKWAESAAIGHYTARAGEIIWAWNQLQHAFQFLFIRSVTPKNPEGGLAIWQAINSDSGQRDVLKAAMKHYRPEMDLVSEGITWLLDVASKLAPHRNDIAHAPTILNWTESGYVIPSRLAKPTHAKRMLAAKSLKQFHRHLRDDLHALTNYAFALSREMNEPNSFKIFPQPPALKSMPQSEVPPTRSQKRARNSGRAPGPHI